MIRATRIRTIADLLNFASGAAGPHVKFLPVEILDAKAMAKEILDLKRQRNLHELRAQGAGDSVFDRARAS